MLFGGVPVKIARAEGNSTGSTVSLASCGQTTQNSYGLVNQFEPTLNRLFDEVGTPQGAELIKPIIDKLRTTLGTLTRA